jgi:hypothetical protein
LKRTLSVTNHEQLKAEDKAYWLSKTPEERLDMVERLRLEAGKFLYDYPARFQRVIEVIERK